MAYTYDEALALLKKEKTVEGFFKIVNETSGALLKPTPDARYTLHAGTMPDGSATWQTVKKLVKGSKRGD